ncbi:hypothetical protein [Streptomyces sp. NPDC086989]|uniref:hypothetical protein n=1 Tax=Streptomyces sp. NPDC086989 TaxID=3365764 RepID=UPI00382B5A37
MTGMDWGTVPAWFGAIGTTGSLSLALAILLRDKRRDDLAEARKLVVSWLTPCGGDGHKVRITNASDRPFISVGMFNLDQWQSDAEMPDGPMLPGECRVYTHDGVGSSALAMRFTDGDGENWVRSLHSYRLYRCPRDPVRARHFQRRWASEVLRTDQVLAAPLPTPLQDVGYRLWRPVRRYLVVPVWYLMTWPVRPRKPRTEVPVPSPRYRL